MIRPVLLLCAVAALSLSGGQTRAGNPVVTSADGRSVQVEGTERVVAIGGAITEILYALGLEDRIVAVDTTSVFPARALKDKPNVGYMRALSPEGVLSTGPDLILAVEGAGPPDVIALLAEASVPFVLLRADTRPDAVAARIRQVAAIMGVERKGEALARTVAGDIALQQQASPAADRPPRRVMFLLLMTGDKAMVGGSATAADAMIAMAQAENVFGGIQGYKQVGDEAIVEAAPDAIVMMNRADHPLSADELFRHPAFALTPAARSRSLIAMDGAYLLAFGPRTAHAARDLARFLYPDAAPADIPPRPWTTDAPSARGD